MRSLVVLVTLGVIVFLTLGTPAPLFGQVSGPVHVGILASQTGQLYRFTGTDSMVTADAAESNADGNIREVFWRTGAPWSADQENCITWDGTAESAGSPGRNRQPGLAMRISPTGKNGVGIKAITITQNVYEGTSNVFWVNLWNVTDTAHPEYRGISQFDTSRITRPDGPVLSPPWHLCARAQGLQFSFKLWTNDKPEPAWDDPTHVFTTRLPAGWDYPGYSGGYIAHLRAGETATFSNQTAQTLHSARTDRAHSAQTIVDFAPASPATPIAAQPTYIG